MTNILDKFKLDGKTAVVTGGAGLLGREFCSILAQAGAKVAAADLDEKTAQAVADEIMVGQGTAIGIGVDVTNESSVKSMVDKTVANFGSLDILVCSAAMDPKFDPEHAEKQNNAFESYPVDMWRSAVDVNLTGLFLCAREASVQMLKQKSGVIINICSTYGLVGPDQRIYEKPGQPPQYKPVYYSVTKAGVLGLTRYLATYFGGKGIRANALTPGGVFNNHQEPFVTNYSSRTVLGRMAKKDEMSGALLFLASDASSYMTGSNLVVDGGWTAW
jgi:NAD(P)-dependent dehydrogenase (short-subunit alcohol dehydrogenase family)